VEFRSRGEGSRREEDKLTKREFGSLLLDSARDLAESFGERRDEYRKRMGSQNRKAILAYGVENKED